MFLNKKKKKKSQFSTLKREKEKEKKRVNSLLTGQCGDDPYIYNMIFALHP